MNRVDERILEQLETLNRNIAKISNGVARLKGINGRHRDFVEDDLSEFAAAEGPLDIIFKKLADLKNEVAQLHADLQTRIRKP